MARIELRDATIRIKDGLAGTALVNEATPGSTDTDVDIDTIVLNTVNTRRVPVGARFTVSTGGNTQVYIVTARVESVGVNQVDTLTASGATAGTFTLTFTIDSSIDTTGAGPFTTAAIAYNAAQSAVQSAVDTALAALPVYVAGDLVVANASTPDLASTTFTYSNSLGSALHPVASVDGTGLTGGGGESFSITTPGEFVQQTTNITFTPAWGTPTPADNDTITFLANSVEVKIGDGNVTYTENKEYEYELDRGILDTVREGDEQPLDVTIDFVYEFVTTGTGESITPVDALKGKGGAAEFVSSDQADACAPYAVDIEIEHDPGSCSGAGNEVSVFPDFRYDTLEFDLDEATISATGRCNVTEPNVSRNVTVNP